MNPSIGDESTEERLTLLDRSLKEIFHRDGFRPHQREIAVSALSDNDLLVLLPTGYGKSLCYQLPSVLYPAGFSIVICPLIALMLNQVESLQKLNINAFCIHGNMEPSEKYQILQALTSNQLSTGSLLYVSPELCFSTEFQQFLDRAHTSGLLNRIVVDEAHCCVEWGRDFRVEYAQLGGLRDRYRGVPLMALTGTASNEMQQLIVQTLHMDRSKNLQIFSTEMHRANLHFEVRYVEDPGERLEDMIKFVRAYRNRISMVYPSVPRLEPYPGCGIIYCRSRATTNRIAQELCSAGIGAKSFHAKLEPHEKTEILNRWVAGDPDYSVVVATIAFGLGVDKPDTRFVIHFEMSTNMEAYVQQSGRAGRDAKAARCILYYSQREHLTCARFAKDANNDSEMKSAMALLRYAKTIDKCRHRLLAEYFDKTNVENIVCQYACDYCKGPRRLQTRYDEWLTSIA